MNADRPKVAWAVVGIALAIGSLVVLCQRPDPQSASFLSLHHWLGAWIIAGIAGLVALILWGAKTRHRPLLLVGGASVFAGVATAIIFAGAQYGWNAHWGDQKIYLAMILRAAEFGIPGDFYYQDLPAFYPPLYFWILGWLAKLTGIAHYTMPKVGYWLIAVILPFMLYGLWRQVVSRFRAAVIALVTLLWFPMFLLAIPHEYLATALFVPWWLGYVQETERTKSLARRMIVGGLIGAAIFSIYFYAFIIGGALLFGQGLWAVVTNAGRSDRVRQLFRSLAVLAATAVGCSWYWGPLLWSMYRADYTYHQQPYFSEGQAVIAFEFTRFTIAGLLYLGGLIYCGTHARRIVPQGLLGLAVAGALLFGAAMLSAEFGFNPLYYKIGDFVRFLGAPVVGLWLATVVRFPRSTPRRLSVPGITLFAVAALALAADWTRLPDRDEIAIAHKRDLPGWMTPAYAAADLRDRVTLTGDEQFASYYPVSLFIPVNQHYSHWAGQYRERHKFLKLLQDVPEPLLMHLALRHNRFDPVDVTMLRRKGDHYPLVLAVNNYPTGTAVDTLRFRAAAFSDSSLLKPVPGTGLLRFSESVPDVSFPSPAAGAASVRDSLRILARWHHLAEHLDDAGRSRTQAWFDAAWQSIRREGEWLALNDDIDITDLQLIPCLDSLYVIVTYRAGRTITDSLRAFLHVVAEAGGSQQNCDFEPVPGTKQWRIGDVITCVQAIPRPAGAIRFKTGLFSDRVRTRGVYTGRFAP